MKGYENVYAAISLVTYFFILLFSFIIVLVVWTEESLHQPMYILICNLVFNGLFGSTSFFPKLIIDLFTKSKIISRAGCFTQALCLLTFGLFEISTIAIMAYDRYLAVCYPMHYRSVINNEKVVKLIGGAFVCSFLANLSCILLIVILPLCGTYIKNIFCSNMAIVNLTCVSISANIVYGTVISMIYLTFTSLFIAYSYGRILIICFTVSKDASKKAIHTLVTHLLSFSIFVIGGFFIFVRYRLISDNTIIHIVLSVIPMVVSPLGNCLIYGLRTKALRTRVRYHLQKISMWRSK
ncbi:olfactory receptor 52D1-like [Discoglossus pictus]